LFFFLATCLLAVPNLAKASWRVVPIRIDLDARNKTGSVKVINEGDTQLRFQLKAARWYQDEAAKDQYEETKELVFFPRILTIPPGEERLVRAGFKVPASDTEKTYRLFIEQIPENTPTSAAQVSILIRFGVPVFSAPLKPEARGDLKVSGIKGQNLELELDNTGNVNFQVHSIAVKGFDAGDNEAFSESIKGWYLLTGHKRVHTIKLPTDICQTSKKLEISVQADKFDLNRVIKLGPEQCGQ
jgi:fimbrial chaperone protein